jgi:nucleoside-diphosphate-sugar epimerase
MCSSTAVFSETAGRMINEDSSVIPKNFRQEALLEGERLVRFYAWSNYAIMRLSGLYDNQLPPPDSWEQTNSWANRIHLDDAAQFILAAALPSLKLQEIFCLTDDHPFVPQDIASLFHLRKANHKYFETYSKRISNLKAKSMLRNILMYPSVHQGYSDFLRIN